MTTPITDELDAVGLEKQVARLEERMEVAEDRLDKHEDAIEKRRRSNEGIRMAAAIHDRDDARLFATLGTQLEANTKMTENIEKRAGRSVTLLWTLTGLVLSGFGVILTVWLYALSKR